MRLRTPRFGPPVLLLFVAFSAQAAHVSSPPPDPPALYGPRTDAGGYTPVVAWSHVADAHAYDVQIAASPGFATLEAKAEQVNVSQWTSPPLAIGVHHWRARGVNLNANGPWSPSREFTIVPPAPCLLAPDQGVATPRKPLLLRWDPVRGPSGAPLDQYEIQVAADGDFGRLRADNETGATQFSYNWTTPGYHYWRVRAIAANQQPEPHDAFAGPWSATRSFRTDSNATDPGEPSAFVCGLATGGKPTQEAPGGCIVHGPGNPAPVSPPEGALLKAWPVLQWTFSSSGQGGHLRVWSTRACQGDAFVFTVEAGRELNLGSLRELRPPGRYYWTVAPPFVDDAYSPPRSFVVLPPTPAPLDEELEPSLRLRWTGWPNSTGLRYEWQVARDPAFSEVHRRGTTPLLEARPPSLDPGTYHWRVRAFLDEGSSEWSPARELALGQATAPAAPACRSPGNEEGLDGPPTIAWEESEGATAYEAEILDEGIPQASSGRQTETRWTEHQLSVGVYEWRVRAWKADQPGPWADCGSFRILSASEASVSTGARTPAPAALWALAALGGLGAWRRRGNVP